MTVPTSADAGPKDEHFTQYQEYEEQAKEHEAHARYHTKAAERLRRKIIL